MSKPTLPAISNDSWTIVQLWLDEVLQNGFAAQQASGLRTIASRLVDMQMGGLAKVFREMAKLDWSDDALSEQIAANLLDIRMAAALVQRFDQLESGLQASLLSFIQGNQKKPDVESLAGFEDQWLVLKVAFDKNEGLRSRKIWLFGLKSKRIIYQEDFAFGPVKFEGYFQAGGVYVAKAVYYPAAVPYRVILHQTQKINITEFPPIAGIQIAHFLKILSNILGQYPIIYPLPVLLDQIEINHLQGKFYLIDKETNSGVQILIDPAISWSLMGLSKQSHLQLFGEYYRGKFYPFAWKSGSVIQEIEGKMEGIN